MRSDWVPRTGTSQPAAGPSSASSSWSNARSLDGSLLSPADVAEPRSPSAARDAIERASRIRSASSGGLPHRLRLAEYFVGTVELKLSPHGAMSMESGLPIFGKDSRVRGERAGRCFYSRGNKTAVPPVRHPVAAKRGSLLGDENRFALSRYAGNKLRPRRVRWLEQVSER